MEIYRYIDIYYKYNGAAKPPRFKKKKKKTATTLIYAIGAGITAAAGTRLALQKKKKNLNPQDCLILCGVSLTCGQLFRALPRLPQGYAFRISFTALIEFMR